MNQSKPAWIYKITSPTGKVYIGSSINYRARFAKYKHLSCKQQSKLYQSFLCHGFDKHSFEVLFTCTSDIMLEMEFYFGCIYSVLDSKKGMNLQLPKITDKFTAISEEGRERRRRNMTGRKVPEHIRIKFVNKTVSIEARLNMRKAQLGKKRSAEAIAKSVAGRIGYKRPPEYCKWLSDSQKGKPRHINTLIGVAKYREKVMKKVIIVKTGQIFNSIADCSAYLKHDQGNIGKMLNYKKTNTKGILFLGHYITLLNRQPCNGSLQHLPLAQLIRNFGFLRQAVA